ncbi:hypothetical protein STRTUCAR8_07653, partial [Streptomyces turgidiscabies Car8]
AIKAGRPIDQHAGSCTGFWSSRWSGPRLADPFGEARV